MKCREVELFLAEYAKGRLSHDEKGPVEAHLETCPRCRESLAEMKEFFRVADMAAPVLGAATEAVQEAIWSGLYERIREEDLHRPGGLTRIKDRLSGRLGKLAEFFRSIPPKPALVGITALLIAVAGIGYYTLRPLSPDERIRLQQEAEAELDDIERQYVIAIEKYSGLVEERKDSIDPELYEIYEDKLAVLDDYIAGCKAAIEENRFNINAREHLLFAFREKVETLREMVSSAAT